jgi:hypothetical protein
LAIVGVCWFSTLVEFMLSKHLRPKFWRGRAEKARLNADQVGDGESRRMLEELAEIYEQLADREDKHLRAFKREARRVQELRRRLKRRMGGPTRKSSQLLS